MKKKVSPAPREAVLDVKRVVRNHIEYLALTPRLPEGVSTGEEQEMSHAKQEPMTRMEFIGDIEESESDALKDIQNLAYDSDGVHVDSEAYGYIFHERGTWFINAQMPPVIQHIFIKALAHEALINPNLSVYAAEISIRLETSEYQEHRKARDNKPHFDAEGSSYLVASAPGTVQYVQDSPDGTLDPQTAASIDSLRFNISAERWFTERGLAKSIAASSVLPMKLYRFDEHVLHSVPWAVPESGEGETQPRFFCRVSFRPPSAYRG
jgi:hypothetical protein